jgi:hypothetical protein
MGEREKIRIQRHAGMLLIRKSCSNICAEGAMKYEKPVRIYGL